MKPFMTPQQAVYAASDASAISLYRKLAAEDASVLGLIYYEFTQALFSNLAGLPGLGLRMLLYPPLFKTCKGRPAVGKCVVLRNPAKVSLGRRCILDDFAVVDARGGKASIDLGDHVTLGRCSSIVSKDADIAIAAGVNIGSHCRIASQSRVEIGESTLIAAYSYIGPGNHQGDGETPLIAREMETRGGVKIGSHVWVGARATILDGVTIGDGAIIGAHSLVRDDVPPGATAVGIPARILGS